MCFTIAFIILKDSSIVSLQASISFVLNKLIASLKLLKDKCVSFQKHFDVNVFDIVIKIRDFNEIFQYKCFLRFLESFLKYELKTETNIGFQMFFQ